MEPAMAFRVRLPYGLYVYMIYISSLETSQRGVLGVIKPDWGGGFRISRDTRCLVVAGILDCETSDMDGFCRYVYDYHGRFNSRSSD